jgi:transducin (beta)-like 1
VELLSKALLFTEAEKHWKGNFACKSGFSLLTPHVCNSELPKSIAKRTDPPVAEQQRLEQQPPNGILDSTISKRKATPPVSKETRAEKRARTEQNNTVSTVPECRFLSSSMTRHSDFHVLVPESNLANQGAPNPVDPPPDPPSGKPPPPVSADHDANPPAVHLLTGHTSEVCDTYPAAILSYNSIMQVFICAWNPVNLEKLASGCT